MNAYYQKKQEEAKQAKQAEEAKTPKPSKKGATKKADPSQASEPAQAQDNDPNKPKLSEQAAKYYNLIMNPQLFAETAQAKSQKEKEEAAAQKALEVCWWLHFFYYIILPLLLQEDPISTPPFTAPDKLKEALLNIHFILPTVIQRAEALVCPLCSCSPVLFDLLLMILFFSHYFFLNFGSLYFSSQLSFPPILT